MANTYYYNSPLADFLAQAKRDAGVKPGSKGYDKVDRILDTLESMQIGQAEAALKQREASARKTNDTEELAAIARAQKVIEAAKKLYEKAIDKEGRTWQDELNDAERDLARARAAQKEPGGNAKDEADAVKAAEARVATARKNLGYTRPDQQKDVGDYPLREQDFNWVLQKMKDSSPKFKAALDGLGKEDRAEVIKALKDRMVGKTQKEIAAMPEWPGSMWLTDDQDAAVKAGLKAAPAAVEAADKRRAASYSLSARDPIEDRGDSMKDNYIDPKAVYVGDGYRSFEAELKKKSPDTAEARSKAAWNEVSRYGNQGYTTAGAIADIDRRLKDKKGLSANDRQKLEDARRMIRHIDQEIENDDAARDGRKPKNLLKGGYTPPSTSRDEAPSTDDNDGKPRTRRDRDRDDDYNPYSNTGGRDRSRSRDRYREDDYGYDGNAPYDQRDRSGRRSDDRYSDDDYGYDGNAPYDQRDRSGRRSDDRYRDDDYGYDGNAPYDQRDGSGRRSDDRYREDDRYNPQYDENAPYDQRDGRGRRTRDDDTRRRDDEPAGIDRAAVTAELKVRFSNESQVAGAVFDEVGRLTGVAGGEEGAFNSGWNKDSRDAVKQRATAIAQEVAKAYVNSNQPLNSMLDDLKRREQSALADYNQYSTSDSKRANEALIEFYALQTAAAALAAERAKAIKTVEGKEGRVPVVEGQDRVNTSFDYDGREKPGARDGDTRNDVDPRIADPYAKGRPDAKSGDTEQALQYDPIVAIQRQLQAWQTDVGDAGRGSTGEFDVLPTGKMDDQTLKALDAFQRYYKFKEVDKDGNPYFGPLSNAMMKYHMAMHQEKDAQGQGSLGGAAITKSEWGLIRDAMADLEDAMAKLSPQERAAMAKAASFKSPEEKVDLKDTKERISYYGKEAPSNNDAITPDAPYAPGYDRGGRSY